MKDILAQGLAQMGITPPPGTVDKLCQYSDLLLEQNKVMNLTAITEPEEVARLHFLDSAAILTWGKETALAPPPSGGSHTWLSGKSLVDVGTGAGALPETFYGLAGVGDLIATCGSPLSRNYTFGYNLGKGMSVEEATKASNGVAEGVATASAVVALGERYHVPTPLAKAVTRLLDDGISFKQMIAEMFPADVTVE